MATFDDHKDFAYSVIPSGGGPSPATSGNSLKVSSAGDRSLFPTPPFRATVWPQGTVPTISNAEIIQVNGYTGADGFVIARAQEGSTAMSLTAGYQIAATITTKPFTDLEAAVNLALQDRVAVLTIATSQSGLAADVICDSNTNDQSTTSTTKINSALVAASLLYPSGFLCKLRTGTFYVKTPGIRVPDNCTLEGEGWGTVVFYANGSAFNGMIGNKNAVIVNQVLTNTGIRIANLMINGNSANAGGNDPRDAVWLKMCSRSTVENLYIYDCPDSGIVLDQDDTRDCHILNNTIDDVNDIGIYVSDGSRNIVSGNTIYNSSSYGIRLIRRVSGECMYNKVSHNWLSGCGQNFSVDGIIADDADLTSIQDNWIIGSGRNGILTQAAYCSISGNNIDLSDAHGIFADAGTVRGSITGNVVHRSSQSASNTFSGIVINSVGDMTVTGNRSGDTGASTRQKYGIEEKGTTNNNTIIGNICDRNGTAGLLILGASTAYANNRV